ncbi:uncharacterized protein LOC100678201 [Nasonia vitripennis]|uniref:Uncharacterized protein n=1 Tax=Nasonia vitripennis TaxID=7425 RepID=A0A7M7GCQ3_NASVI|nr:uncharacterized protein LOC100678201 [Nasonia vitripennis]
MVNTVSNLSTLRMKSVLIVCLLAVYQVQAQLTCSKRDCSPGFFCKDGRCLPRETCEAINCRSETGCTTTTILCQPGYGCQEGKCVKKFPSNITCDRVRCRSGYVCVEPARCVKRKPIDVRCFTVKCRPGYICVNGVCVQG